MITGRIASLFLAATLAILAMPASASEAAAVPASMEQAATTPAAADAATADKADAVVRLKQIYHCRAKPQQLEAAADCMKLIGFIDEFTGVRS